jgi:environmental stress-induced protein Ves
MTLPPRIIRYRDLKWVPWKNRGGFAADLVVAPDLAGWDDFDWRVSTAIVEREGPFSHFPDCDRGMLILSEGVLRLTVHGLRDPVDLQRAGQVNAFVFPGDVPVTGQPLAGAVTNINVMVHRGRFGFQMRARQYLGSQTINAPLAHVLIGHVNAGRLAVEGLGELEVGDTAVMTPGTAVTTRETCQLVWIGIDPVNVRPS